VNGLPTGTGGYGGMAAGAARGAGGLGGIVSGIGQAVPYVALADMAISTISSVLGIKHGIGGIFGVVGNLVASLFGGTKKGVATIGFDQYGELGVTSTGGNSKKRIGAASDAANSVIAALQQIADAVGGDLTGTPSVSIAMRNKSWRVDTSGTGQTQKKDSTVVDFGKDQEAAIRFAISDALADGVIAGISDASKRILASGRQLEQAIEKVVLIESIPKLLKQRLDPLGAAIDELNERWEAVWEALREGAASAEQMAEAQQLYNLELQEVKDQLGGVSGALNSSSESLRQFLQSLQFGPSSPYSLDYQHAAAEKALKPHLDAIKKGEPIDQQAYLQAAGAYLDVSRQLYGSTPQFFSELSKIQKATEKAIEKIDGVAPITTASDPYIEQTASNTRAIADIGAQQRDALLAHREELRNIRAEIGRLHEAIRNAWIGSSSGLNTAVA